MTEPYDPRAHGALCDLCVLNTMRSGLPIGPELHRGAEFLIVGEAPGEEEVKYTKPFIGRSGAEIITALNVFGLDRDRLSLTNACCCRPPNNDFGAVVKRLTALNRERKAVGQPPMPLPWVACRPRLIGELVQHTNVLALGSIGIRAVFNDPDAGVTKLRGFPAQVSIDLGGGVTHPLMVMPTFHPAFVLRQRRWTKVFRADIGRGIRIARGGDPWTPPEAVYTPSPAQLRAFLLGERHPFWAYDVETRRASEKQVDGSRKKDIRFDALRDRLNCIGFGVPSKAMVVPFWSIETYHQDFYTDGEMAEIREILREFFLDRSRLKTGWNCGSYDRMVIENQLGYTPVPVIDGILLHRAVDGELPHSLGFVASCWAEVPRAWKADNTANNAKRDVELFEYNSIDCAVTARIIEPLWDAVVNRNQQRVIEIDHKIQGYCTGMHTNGLFIDQARRRERERNTMEGEPIPPAKRAKFLTPEGAIKDPMHYVLEPDGTVKKKGILHYLATARMACCDPTLNPGSGFQVAKVIYDRWGNEVEDKTESGAPSTGDNVILKMMAELVGANGKIRHPERYEFLDAVRWYRRLAKERGTFVLKLRPENETFGKSIDLHALDGDRPDNVKHDGCVGIDGRLHPGWNSHTTCTGRLSSSDPMNAQTVPVPLRDMIIPAPGHEFVTADMDQIELRAVAALARASRLLEVFHRIYAKRKRGEKVDKLNPNEDPYSANAAAIFENEWKTAGADSKDRIRTFAKIFVLSSIYGADPVVKWDILRGTEDKEGRLVYLKISQRQVRERHDAWCSVNMEIVEWWDHVWNEFRRQGYLIEPVLGRRRDFLDDDNEDEVKKEVFNFKAQSLSSGLVHLSTIQIVENLIPFYKWGPGTGLVAQVHDSLTFEVPIGMGNVLLPQVIEAMECRAPGLDVPFTASGLVQTKWSEK